MRSARRIPLTVYAAAAALAAIGGPALLTVAWRALVWRSAGTPDAAASLDELAVVAAVLGLLVAGQLVVLVGRRREVDDAVAAGDARDLEAAVRRVLRSVRLAAGAGALALLAYLAVAAAAASQTARTGLDWPGFAATLALLTGPALVAVAAPAWLVGLRDAGAAGLVRAVRNARASTLVAILALGAVLLGASAGFALAQRTCQPGGGAAFCGAANASMGQVVGLIGPAVTLLALAVAERGLRALWALRTASAGAGRIVSPS